MATLTAQKIVKTGLNPSLAAAAGGGDEFSWDDDAYLRVANGDASSKDVTVASQRPAASGYSVADLIVSVPAGEERWIGPFERAAFADSNSNVQISYSDVTSVTVGVFQLPNL